MLEKYPFLAIVRYSNIEYVCIIQNQDSDVTTIYDCNTLHDSDKSEFLRLADQWWWESNRLIPINLFLGSQISEYRNWILNMNSKDVSIIWGPETSLNNIIQKRIKRRSVQLVRKID